MSAAADRDLDVLWRPVRIGAVTIANRICVPAHQTIFPARELEVVGDRYIAYMEARARGGAGLLVVEAGAVHESTAKVGLIDLYRERIVPGLRTLAEAVWYISQCRFRYGKIKQQHSMQQSAIDQIRSFRESIPGMGGPPWNARLEELLVQLEAELK